MKTKLDGQEERVPMSAEEQETIIRFDKTKGKASIFTYEYKWKKHLEKNLGLKPIMNNGQGGREYEIDKKRISLPRKPKVMSDENRVKAAKRMKDWQVKTTKAEKKGLAARQSQFI